MTLKVKKQDIHVLIFEYSNMIVLANFTISLVQHTLFYKYALKTPSNPSKSFIVLTCIVEH